MRQALGSRPVRDPRWRDDAACRTAEVDLFFPEGDSGDESDTIRAAKAVCRVCPVCDACLQYAFETRQTDGIWGGTTEGERRKLRRAWLAGRKLRPAEAQVAPAVSSAPEPERPVEGVTAASGRAVVRPPWAGAAPPTPSPFISAEQDRRPIRSGQRPPTAGR